MCPQGLVNAPQSEEEKHQQQQAKARLMGGIPLSLQQLPVQDSTQPRVDVPAGFSECTTVGRREASTAAGQGSLDGWHPTVFATTPCTTSTTAKSDRACRVQ